MLGDSLTFSGDSRQFSARVTSLRRVDWESLRPNFYFIFPPGGLEGQPQSWLTSLRYDGDTRFLAELNRRFPTLTLVDMGALLLQARQILDQVGRALEVMVLLVVLCGVLLLLAQMQVGMDQRRQELQIYRILGASRRVLRRTLYAEFMLLGLPQARWPPLPPRGRCGCCSGRCLTFPGSPPGRCGYCCRRVLRCC